MRNKIVLINGIGCLKTGARLILEKFILSKPKDIYLIVFSTSNSIKEIRSIITQKNERGIFLVPLPKLLFGKYLRLLYEVLMYLLSKVDYINLILNLSNFSLASSKKVITYMHNPIIFSEESELVKRSEGFLLIKKFLLKRTLYRNKMIIVQTSHFKKIIESYCTKYNIKVPKIEVLFPYIVNPIHVRKIPKKYTFELFYPSSNFPHKFNELAINAVIQANKYDNQIGLKITAPKEKYNRNNCITYLNQISKKEVLENLSVADALLFTSKYETLGLPLLEAIDYGIPIIAPYLEYSIEILGESSCYFHNYSIDSIVESILNMKLRKKEFDESIIQQKKVIEEKSISWDNQWEIILDSKRK